MSIAIRYFASIRERLGASQSLAAEPGLTVGGVRDRLIAADPLRAEVLARGRALRAALNQELCDESAPVRDGDEVAFFPPVTGG